MSLSATSTWLLNPSSNGVSTTPLGSLFQVLLSGEVFCLISNPNLPCFNLRPSPLVLFLWRRGRGHHSLKMAAVAQVCIICYQSRHGKVSLPSELPKKHQVSGLSFSHPYMWNETHPEKAISISPLRNKFKHPDLGSYHEGGAKGPKF